MKKDLNLPKSSESLSCPKHGLRLGTPKDGTCELCTGVCGGCGAQLDTIGTRASLAGAGIKDEHKACKRELNSFWIKRPV